VQVDLWTGELVAFEFDLTEMRDQDAVGNVCQVARVIGLSTGRPVVFLPEGEPMSSAVFTFDPLSDGFQLVRDDG
jgi:hypothetical protein